MKQEVNIIVGRFQPFTFGHLKCAEEVYKAKKLKTVVCLVDSPKPDKRHPFPTSVSLDIIKNINSNLIEDVIVVKNAYIGDIDAVVSEKYSIRTWACGTDRVDSYVKMTDKYRKDAACQLNSNFEVFEIKRGDEDISATKARKLILDGDTQGLAKVCPPVVVKKMGVLKKYIEKVTESKMVSLSEFIMEGLNVRAPLSLDPYDTFIVVKPGFMGKIDSILDIFMKEGYRIVKCQKQRLHRTAAERLYTVHKKEKFYNDLVEYMCSGDSCGFLLYSGCQNPDDAIQMTNIIKDIIRKKWSKSEMKNVLHSSDSWKNLQKESSVYFEN